jgi:hypothetical protein
VGEKHVLEFTWEVMVLEQRAQLSKLPYGFMIVLFAQGVCVGVHNIIHGNICQIQCPYLI